MTDMNDMGTGAPVGGGTTTPSRDARTFAMLAHLLGGVGNLICGIPCFIAPLIIWLMKKDEDAFVADQSREALNFQLTVLIAHAIGIVLNFMLPCVGSLIWFAVAIVGLVFGIIGGVQANNGVLYRYPFKLGLIK